MAEEYRAEMAGVLRVGQLARPRQVEVVEPRNPETQRPGAQHRGPGLALGAAERTRLGVGGEQRGGARRIERTVLLHAPVVHRDGDVVEERPGAAEVEVDDARDGAVLEEDVV